MSDTTASASSINVLPRGRRREKTAYHRTTPADKKRLLTCARNGGDWKSMAETMQIKYHTAYRIVRTDDSPMRKPGGSKRKLTEEHELALRAMVDDNPTITLLQLRDNLEIRFNISVSLSTIDRCLDRHLYSFKLLQYIPEHRNRNDVKNARAEYAQWLREEGLQQLRIYLDETNFNLWCCRRKGRSKIGTSPRVMQTSSKGANVNIIAALTANGVLKFKIFPRVTHSQVNEFITEISVEGQRFVLILDNAPSHKRVSDVSLEDGQAIKFLPAYSPMLNPIEELFSSVKTEVKRKLVEQKAQLLNVPERLSIKEHRRNILTSLVQAAFSNMRAEFCGNWERHMFSFLDDCIAFRDL